MNKGYGHCGQYHSKIRPKYLGLVLTSFFLLHLQCQHKNFSLEPMKESLLLQKVDLPAPMADKVPHSMEKHGDKRVDDYYWIRLSDEQKLASIPDSHTQKVVQHLKSENDYTSKMLEHTTDLQAELYREIVGRIKQDDQSVPYRRNGYIYTLKYEEGKEYPIRTRIKSNGTRKEEEVFLDENEEALGKKYYNTGEIAISPDNRYLAVAEDTLSRRQYTIRFKDLYTGQWLKDKIENTTGNLIWAMDNKTLFYGVNDRSLRAYKIKKHTLGSPVEHDVEVYHERDESFNTYVWRTKSDKYLIIESRATLSQEFWILDADKPNAQFALFQSREKNLEYSIEHFGDHWYIRTNMDQAVNFKLMSCPLGQTSKDHWVDLLPHRSDILVEGFEIFKYYLVILERIRGITHLRVRSWDGTIDYYLDFDEDTYAVNLLDNYDFDTDVLRFSYSSLTTPLSIYEFDMRAQKRTLLKRQEVLGNFDPTHYQSERLYATARDGTLVPISLVYKKSLRHMPDRPLLLYGYGSYGVSLEPFFSSSRLSLLDRGFIFAIAHVRGGEELGRKWYDEGKLLKKKNTFTDFIDCAEFLIREKYAHPNKIFAQGGSAGGLLMGAVANLRPDLWAGIISEVPFLDVLTTMLDESIPLTTGEYDEWGNPNDRIYYDYIKSYSPYDNIEAKDYPPMLVTTGFHDSQVQYWEPAKYVAKLRAVKTDKNPVLLHCNMDVGHGGASGRFSMHKETALIYAFLLDLAGI